jgi:integrase
VVTWIHPDAFNAQEASVNTFDVRVHAIRRRSDRRRPFEVRWHVGATAKSKSFLTRGLADSYRAELVRAARKGLAFDPATGEPVLWAAPAPVTVSWYQHAIGYADMKWPRLAAHSRASLAEALATVTPALTRPARRRPSARTLRAVLYRHAFNPSHRHDIPDSTPGALAWLERASLPVQSLADPQTTRRALDALALRLDGTRAAPDTISRKRAAFHGALGYAVELGLLTVNPLTQLCWGTPHADTATSPLTVASPDQVRAILAQVAAVRPELTAFFGCLYYAALRPEEAVALRRADLILPSHGWGKLILTTACPRTAAAWTATGTAHELRGLKHRPHDAVRVIPIPPELVALLSWHLDRYGTTPDGLLFRGTRGGILSESVYGRAWHAARGAALGPDLAMTPLARRPYDLRHAALSLWLDATADPARVAARAGKSVSVLHDVYTHCISGHDDTANQQIERALRPHEQPHQRKASRKASGAPHRRHPLIPVRYMSVNGPRPAARTADRRTPSASHQNPPG